MAAPIIIARAAAVVIPFLKKHPWIIPAAIIAPIVVSIIIFTIVGGAISGLSSVRMFINPDCAAPKESSVVFWDSEEEINTTGSGCTFSSQGFYADGTWVYPLGDNLNQITDDYGPRILNGEPDWHDAVDLDGDYGDPVYAISNGQVTKVVRGNGGEGWCGKGSGATAAWVDINHGNGVNAQYYHIDPVSSLQVGDIVKPGQLIGHIANRGYVCGSHLHFHMDMNGVSRTINPEDFFAKAGKPFRAPVHR